ncbi:unnamed protein product [Brachionus calyciflorus]|uniref:Uncharacterized protein n=1 Tax=Brachionus calyciflorus TaxID=104777 RepID=A0A813TXU1_9BILA|nr:unnamed protein product [Brachionus calyciflorus]
MGKKKVCDNVKWQIVDLLKDGGKTQQEIAELVGVSQKCVSSIKKKHECTGQVSDFKRSGRPRKLNNLDEAYIFREIRKYPSLSCNNLAVNFNTKFTNVKVSKATIRRLILRKGLEYPMAFRKPMLTVQDRIKRYKWCKQRLNWTANDWARVIFSDESNFEVFNHKARVKRFKVKRLKNESETIGIWGCISSKGTGVCNIYTGRIDQFVYKDTLENQLLPSVELFYNTDDQWIFQQDDALAHTDNSIIDWFKEQNIQVLTWCPRSPDLNPIQNLFLFMEAKMVNTKITSIDHLKQVLHKEWLSISELNKFYAKESILVLEQKVAILNIDKHI